MKIYEGNTVKNRKGWLITNTFLHSEKFDEISRWLLRAFEKAGMRLTLHTNAEFAVQYDAEGVGIYFINADQMPICENAPHDDRTHGKQQLLTKEQLPDFILFWDKDILLARAFEAQGIRVFNRANAIAACDDKLLTHRLLAGHGIRMPRTIAAPMTYANVGYTDFGFLRNAEKAFGYSFVVKEAFGSFGAQVYLVHNREEAVGLLESLGGKSLLLQEYIAASCGRDVRIHVVGDRVVTAMLRTNDHDFRANITNGGEMTPYTPTAAQAETAVKACQILGLDFAGVDLLFGEDGAPVLCEVNSNAHFKNIFDCTGVNVAEEIAVYIEKNLNKA